MSFDPIENSEITEGRPLKAATFTKIQNSFDDHEGRIQYLESLEGMPPEILSVNGPYGLYGAPHLGIIEWKAPMDMTIYGAFLCIKTAGTVGVTAIDIRRVRVGDVEKRSLFTDAGKPKVDFSAGDDAVSTNSIFDGQIRNLIEGDILLIDITSVQQGADGFMIRLDVAKRF